MRKIMIIGSGCSGYTAAIYTARANLSPLLISGMEMGGQLMLTSDIENFPGFPDGITGGELMDRMKAQAEKFKTEIWMDTVERVDFKSSPYKVFTANGQEESAEVVIIATGASAKWLGIESEKKFFGKGVSACAVCDAAFYKGKEVALVGGGDVALEDALVLTRFATKVSLIHRRQEFRGSKIMQDRVKNSPKISLVLDSVVEEVVGRDNVEGVRVKNVKNSQMTTIPCSGFFVAIGHQPNTKFLEGQIKLDEKGYVETDGRSRTNVPGIFACGDVSDSIYRQAITASGSGCMAALEAERFLEN